MKRIRKKLPWMWLSFAENGFRGVVILRARDIIEAVAITTRLGINPGGQALAIVQPPSFTPPQKAVLRLLSRVDINELMPEMDAISIKEWEAWKK